MNGLLFVGGLVYASLGFGWLWVWRSGRRRGKDPLPWAPWGGLGFVMGGLGWMADAILSPGLAVSVALHLAGIGAFGIAVWTILRARRNAA